MANEKEEKFQIASLWFAMVHLVSETTLSQIFFVSIVCVWPTKNLQQFEKKVPLSTEDDATVTIGHLLLLLCKTP